MAHSFRFLSLSYVLALTLGVATLVPAGGALSAQQKPYVSYNPVVEKLKQGKHVFGVSTSDLSLQNARSLGQEDSIDYVYLDMEHNPMRFEEIEIFIAGLLDPEGILKRGSTQMHPAVFARFPPVRGEELWIIKHAIDLGLIGILSPRTETKEQAEAIVRAMRPNQRRDSLIPNPPGERETDSAGHSDLWPLNPIGDLIFWPMIETRLGVQNADAIAQVPGVGGFYLGSLGDLHVSYGAPTANDPEVEGALQSILKVCKARKIACGGTVSAANVAKRVSDGYQIVNFGGANGGLTRANGAALDGAMKAGAKR